MFESETHATFWDHLDQLRKTFIYSLLIIACGVLVSFFFYAPCIRFLVKPLTELSHGESSNRHLSHFTYEKKRLKNLGSDKQFYTLSSSEKVVYASDGVIAISSLSYEIPAGDFLDIEKERESMPLILFSPIEGMVTALKVSLVMGVIGTAPLWGLCLFRFIAPALSFSVKQVVLPFFFMSIGFIGLGSYFAYTWTIPIANGYLWNFNAQLGQNFWGLSHYLSYTLLLMIANAVAFEGFVILLFLIHFGVFSSAVLSAKRRHFIVLAFILGALLTPPDVFTQFLLAIPLIFLYECAILYARAREYFQELKLDKIWV